MNSNFNIDELLRQSLLDLDPNNPANDALFDMASKNAFNTDWKVSSTATPKKGNTSIFSNWKFYLSAIGGIALIGTVFLLLKENKTPEKITIIKQPATTVLVSEKKSIENNIEKKKLVIAPFKNYLPANTYSINDASTVAQGESLVQTEIKTTNETLNTEISENSNTYAENSNNYKIFSESDKTQVEEKITQLVTKLTIGLTTEFPMIPGAAGSSNGKSFQVAFYMWPNEVTVSEYELFLNHLLLNGNYQEFESYRPNLNNHSVSSLSDEDVAFFHQYFTDEKYSNHPVIFVSAEGAQAYCKWLQDLVNQQNKFEQNKTTVVRLPSKWEWERAAAGGKEHIDYGTADGQLATGFMHHNPEANYREYQRNSFSFTNTKTQKKEKHLTQFFQFTTPVKSFKPNSYGLFDMSGNVSEMVIDMNGKIMTKGGNWNSSKEFLKIRDDDFNEFPKGAIASPFIGFRPVLNFN